MGSVQSILNYSRMALSVQTKGLSFQMYQTQSVVMAIQLALPLARTWQAKIWCSGVSSSLFQSRHVAEGDCFQMNQTVPVRIIYLVLALYILFSVWRLSKLVCMLFKVILWFRRFRVDFSMASFSNHCSQYLNTFILMIFIHSVFDRPIERMLIISGWSYFLRILLVIITQLCMLPYVFHVSMVRGKATMLDLFLASLFGVGDSRPFQRYVKLMPSQISQL